MSRPNSMDGLCSVVLPGRLDRTLFRLPVLRALYDSGRRLAVIAPRRLEPVLRHQAGVETVLEWDRGSHGPRDLQRCLGGLPEVVLLRHGPLDEGPTGGLGGLVDAFAARRAGVPRRWGYAPGLWGRFLGPGLLAPAVRPPSRRRVAERHATEDFRELLEAMEVPVPGDWWPRLALSEQIAAGARERLDRAGLEGAGRGSEGPLVALLPGGDLVRDRKEKPDRPRRWPWRRFAELAQRLRRELSGLRCVLVAGREPLWPAVRVHEETARFVPLVGPDLDAAGLAGVLAACHLTVGADSELLQLAAAVGTPTVALFGPSDPARHRPRGRAPRDLAGRSGIDDGGAGRTGHRIVRGPGGDLRYLQVEPVLEACLELLASPGTGRPVPGGDGPAG